MNKRKAHHYAKSIMKVKPQYVLIAAVLCACVSLIALRANNQKMGELRDQLYAADKADGDVQGALKNLQQHVTTHMNTNLSSGNSVYPPIQLQYTYERLTQKSAASSSNADLYTQAQAHCQQQNATDFSGRNRIPCIEQYVQEHGAQSVKPVPSDLYRFNFLSPRWSPDVAGWSLVVAVALFIAGIARWVFGRWYKYLA